MPFDVYHTQSIAKGQVFDIRIDCTRDRESLQIKQVTLLVQGDTGPTMTPVRSSFPCTPLGITRMKTHIAFLAQEKVEGILDLLDSLRKKEQTNEQQS
jgi:hypothetical protein